VPLSSLGKSRLYQDDSKQIVGKVGLVERDNLIWFYSLNTLFMYKRSTFHMHVEVIT
jgi:hypothetical protein